MSYRFLAFLLLFAFNLAVRADGIIFPPQPRPPGIPIDAFPAPRLDQMQNFLDHIHQARTSGRIDLILDGDSITDYWQGAGRDLFLKDYLPRNVVDFAIAGDGTEHVLWRLQHGELQTLHPKLAMLQVGTNNLEESSAQEIAAGITRIVRSYRTQCPDMHILLLGIFPRAPSPTDPVRAKIREVNTLISKLDDGQHITYLDIGDKFLQPDGTLTREIMPDFLNPSAKGYQIWADAVQPVMDKYCPAAPRGPSPPHNIAEIEASLPKMSWPYPTQPPAGTPAALFPMPRSDWLTRFAADQQREKQGPYDFVIDGDSITELWQAGSRGMPVWKQHWARIKVLDNAISGDQAQHILWRVQNGDLAGLDPKLIMLMAGTNNAGHDPKAVAQGVRKILDEYEKRTHAHILLLGLFPRTASPTDPLRAWVKSINAILSTYASDPRVTYMDIGDKFLQPDGTLTKEIMPDFLHPSTKGFEIWADAVQPVIDRYFPNAAAK